MPERPQLSRELCAIRSTQEYEFVRFHQGTHVSFDVQGKHMSGEIQGIAMAEAPGCTTYIIRLEQDLSPTYPYTHIAIPANMLTVVV